MNYEQALKTLLAGNFYEDNGELEWSWIDGAGALKKYGGAELVEFLIKTREEALKEGYVQVCEY